MESGIGRTNKQRAVLALSVVAIALALATTIFGFIGLMGGGDPSSGLDVIALLLVLVGAFDLVCGLFGIRCASDVAKTDPFLSISIVTLILSLVSAFSSPNLLNVGSAALTLACVLLAIGICVEEDT